MFGHNYRHWHWGKMNRLEFKHPLGRVRPLNLLFNYGPVQTSGGNYQVNPFKAFGCENRFDVQVGPSTRVLVDFDNPEESLGVLPLGQSGHLFSRNYSNQNQLYMNYKYRKQLMDWEKLQKGKHTIITFTVESE